MAPFRRSGILRATLIRGKNRDPEEKSPLRTGKKGSLLLNGDLTVLSADPASDPLAFAKVRYAIRGGKVIASAATAASGK